MKKHHPLMALRLVLVTFLLAAALGVPICQAQITPPDLMSYQGYLTDGSGSALGVPNPKNYNVLFRVWNVQTGGTVGGSSELYAEQQTVTVDNGYFSVLLGQGSSYPGEPTASAISGVFTNSGATKLYVEMVVLGIGPGGINVTIAPRLQLLTSPYSFLAANANTLVSPAGSALLATSAGGSLTVNGPLTMGGSYSITGNNISGTFSGNGSSLTSLNASQITSGTLPSARLNGTYSSALTLNNSGNSYSGSGLSITAGGNDTFAMGGFPSFGGGYSLAATFSGLGNLSPLLRFSGAAGGSWADIGQSPNGNFAIKQNDSEKLVVTTGGWVGIGTTGPQAPLEVDGISTAFYVSGPYFYNGSASFGTFGANTVEYVSIKSQWYVDAFGFIAQSDQRIKDILGREDSDKDLKAVNDLQVTDYRMKDRLVAGDAIHKGFIAQEVQKVIPEAVHKSQKFIPDIYAIADQLQFNSAAQTLRVSLGKAHGLKKGERVRLITDDGDIEHEVSTVWDDKTIEVAGITTEPKRVFVYGKQVDDFLSVDYDCIFTTGIGAIQELSKRVESLEKREARVSELEQQVADLKKMVEQLEGASKSAKVTAAPSPASRPMSLAAASLDQ